MNETPNARANAKNPNNDAHRASVKNRGNQLNPDHSAYHSSRHSGTSPLPTKDKNQKGGKKGN